MQFDIERRWRIVTFMKSSGGDVDFAAKHTPCSKKLVRRWWQRYCSTGSVEDAKRCGRPVLLSAAESKRALGKLLQAGSSGAGDVAHQLAAAGVTDKVLHKTTIIRAARRAARAKGKKLLAKKSAPARGLTQATRAKRIAFAKACRKMNWQSVMFTDRKRFYLRYPGSKVKPVRWVLDGEEADDVFQPTCPLCVNVYAGITPYGMTAMHFVAGTSKQKTQYKTQQQKAARNITKSEYKDVLWKTLLPAGTKLFKRASWYLQQDNDPSHGVTAQVLEQWNNSSAANVQLLPNWPPSSPDLNIIENVWAIVQQKVNSMGCKNFEEFKHAVEETFVAMPQDVIDNLYSSLEKRIRLVLQNDGGYTKY